MKTFSRVSILGLGAVLFLAACDNASDVQAPGAPGVNAAQLADNAGDGAASFERLELCKVWSDASTIATDFDVDVVDGDGFGTGSATRTLTASASSECREVATFDGTNNGDAEGPGTLSITETSPGGTELVSISATAIGRSGGAAGTINVNSGTPTASGFGMSLDLAAQSFSTGTVDNTQGFLVTFVNRAIPQEGGGEGCTPGYWKNHAGIYSFSNGGKKKPSTWVGYLPTDFYDTVFGVTSGFGATFRLIDALEEGGGDENAFARHAVSALLNAASSVDYDLSVAEVIALVQAAYGSGDFEGTKNIFAAFNEQECPLGNGL